ncbi:MAG: DMT family transporter, partial [Gemmatimonadota bacterium]|nr:DMT family transporter [Gemmatimonadota bacterium]
ASLLGISVAGPLTRLSSADPLAIAAGRIAFSLVAIAVMLAITGEWRELGQLVRAEWLLAVAAGVVLALHFWAWNASIHLTTIAASTTLVTSLQPAFVVVLSIVIVHETPRRSQLVGLGIATLGALVITAPDFMRGAATAATPHPLLGNMLSIAAAAAAAMYMVVGRRLRSRLGAWSYVALVYGTALVTLLSVATVSGIHVAPQPPRDLLIFLALAIGPMLLGHTGMNWALKHLPAYVVNLTMLGEPVGATILAMVLPGIHEIPRWTTLAGGAVILLGFIITVWNGSDDSKQMAEPS